MHHLPNLLSLLRLLAVLPVAWMMLEGHLWLAFWGFLLLGLTDALDGWLARRFHWQSRLGSILDPLADKALLLVSYAVLGVNGWLPWWLVLLVWLRDLVIVAGALLFYHRIGAFEVTPSQLSKWNTLLQVVLVLGVLQAQLYACCAAMLALGVVAVAMTTLASGVHYVWLWGGKARCSNPGR